mmetsp:Transcript_13848/g.44385  ORF Transcript_13848/g.44385 Transcript_13848/m.44385 type:complete len:264 (+) Transcript_13848:1696-2487(+)
MRYVRRQRPRRRQRRHHRPCRDHHYRHRCLRRHFRHARRRRHRRPHLNRRRLGGLQRHQRRPLHSSLRERLTPPRLRRHRCHHPRCRHHRLHRRRRLRPRRRPRRRPRFRGPFISAAGRVRSVVDASRGRGLGPGAGQRDASQPSMGGPSGWGIRSGRGGGSAAHHVLRWWCPCRLDTRPAQPSPAVVRAPVCTLRGGIVSPPRPAADLHPPPPPFVRHGPGRRPGAGGWPHRHARLAPPVPRPLLPPPTDRLASHSSLDVWD